MRNILALLGGVAVLMFITKRKQPEAPTVTDIIAEGAEAVKTVIESLPDLTAPVDSTSTVEPMTPLGEATGLSF